MTRAFHAVAISAFCLVCFLLPTGCRAQAGNPASREREWNLAWSDEFGGPNGSGVDPTKWVLEVGGGGWGNQELEYYTNRLQNAYVQDGRLVIRVQREKYKGKDGVTRDYTSARLKTHGKFSQTYGRFEARAKIPYGQVLWPAFWMLGDNIDSADWPACGEIDIMENVGKEPSIVHGTIHGRDIPVVRESGIPIRCPLESDLRTTSTFLPWSGSPTRSAFMSTVIFTRPGLAPIFLKADSGCSITPFFF